MGFRILAADTQRHAGRTLQLKLTLGHVKVKLDLNNQTKKILVQLKRER